MHIANGESGLVNAPTGCGKTRFVEHMAWRLERPLITVACNEDMTASDLVGRFLLDKEGTKWQDGPLTTAARIGAICYLDEVVEARQDTTVVIHPLTDHRRTLPLDKKGELIEGGMEPKTDLTYALWENFLEHVKAKKQGTLSTPELGAAAFTTVNMGVQSYRFGKALFWDKEQRKTTEADASWAAAWEKRSKDRGKPNQIIGWEGGNAGSELKPPAYMKLAGPWIDGKDPGEA